MSGFLFCVFGCSTAGNGLPSTDHLWAGGVVQGALQPIANAEVHLYAADPQNVSSRQNVELAPAVRSDSNGAFRFPATVACPTASAVIYMKAMGGVPAVTGLENRSITLLNVLGTCSTLSAETTATINEVSTVGAAWPLAAFATSSGQFLPANGQAAQFSEAVELVGKLVNSNLGTTPGQLLTASEAALVPAINSLANAIAACIVTNGGLAGDGNACGQLFSLAGYNSDKLPTDTLAAALLLAKDSGRNVAGLYALSTSKAIFQPALTSAPSDWSLATRSVGTLPVLTAAVTAPPTALADTTAAPAVSASTDSTIPAMVHALPQATPLVANTIVIKTGGTYQGNWVSTDPTVAAVSVQTDQPVIIQNSTVTGPGNLIVATGSSGANLTLQNVTGTGLDPQVAGKARGAFLVAYIMNSLSVQNCTMTGTMFGVKVGFSTVTSLKVLNNQAINLEDRLSDGSGGFQATRTQPGKFILFYQVVATNGAEIGWNQMVQTMGQSSTDNAIEIYKSQGTPATPILVHDNYVEGMSSPAVTTYNASGLAATGDNTTLESTFINFVSNEIVHTAGNGLTISNGHDVTAQANRVVSCAQNSSGTWYAAAGVDAVVLWNKSYSPSFYNNTITTTAGGMITPNASGNPVPSDSSANPVDLQTTSNSVGGNLFTDPCLVNGVLTLSAEDTERAFWANKLSTNNQTMGDQHGLVAVTLSPATSTLNPLQTQQLSAAVTGATNTAVTWAINSAVGTISPTGLYTAPATVTAQQTVIATATSVQDTTKTATAVIILNPPVSVSVTPVMVALLPSATQQFTAAVNNAANAAVTWSMSPATGTLSATGLYTAPASITAQSTVTVTATSVQDNTRTATAIVTMTPAVSLAISPSSGALVLSQVQQLTATVTNTANTSVTWSISPAVGTISTTGIYTAPATLASSTAVTVTATSAADPTKTASATLTVNPAPVVISPATVSLYASQTQQFTPQAQGTTNQSFVWSMSPSVGTLSTTGLYTAPSLVTGQQSTTISAYSMALGKYTNVQVTLLPPVVVNLYSTYFTDTVNQTNQFTAQVQNTSNTAVTWSISPAVGTVSATGLYTAPTTITAQQTVTFTATSVADPTKSASGSVLLNPPVKVAMAITSATLLPGATQQLTAYVSWSSNTAVTWSVSPSLGTLSTAGLYTAPIGTTTVQTVIVTATSVADPTKSAVATLILNPPVSVSVTPATATVTLNQAQIYTATILNSTNTNVTWALNPAVGSISTAGRYTPPTTAVTTPQTVTITATSAADTTKLATSTVTVNPPVAITVSPTNTSLSASQTQQFTPSVQWNSNQGANYSISPAVGSISATGLYTAPASITSQQGVSVTVSSAADSSKYVLASITLLPPVVVNLYAGYFGDSVNQTNQLAAQVQNTSNTAVTWSISPAVGTVSASGLYTAPASITAQQTVTFTATSVADPTKSASGYIVLVPPIKVAMAVATATLLPGMTQQLTAYVSWSSNTAVTWSMSPSLGMLSNAGLYTAPTGTTTVQTVIVTATSVADPTKSAAATMTLNPPVSVSVTPATSTVTIGQGQLYTATVLNTSNSNVTWSISPVSGTISTGGRYTPPTTAVTAPQTVTVTATSVVDTTKSASAAVTVNPPVAITVSPAATSLYASQTQQFTPSVQWNSNQGANYSISPSVGSISATGIYTAPSSITSQQGVTVTVSSAADSTKYVLATVTLLPPVSVNLSSAAYFVDTVGQTSQFTAQVFSAANTAVTWTISPAVGSISSTGLYAAPATIRAQQAITVTATSVADATKSAFGTVVLNPPVNVALAPVSVILTTSHTQQFTASVAWNSNTAVTWSMNSSSGTLTAGGLYTAPAMITANSTVTVTATSVADPTKSATSTINLLTLLGPAPIVITEGGTYAGNWISSDPTVPAVTINTDAPVIIENSTMQGPGQLILINGISGANVTVQNVTGTGLDPNIPGQQRGAFISAYIMQSLIVRNNTMNGVSFGVKIGTSPALTTLSIMNNVGSQLEDRASNGAGGLTTSRPAFGHFIALYNVTAPNGGEIGWNKMVQTIGQSSVEDAVNVYNSQGASGSPVLVHDNYLEGYSSSTIAPYTGNGLITDGDASGVTAFIVFKANEMVHTAGGGVALASGHDNSAMGNRIVSCGKDSSGTWYSRAGTSATVVWNYYGSTNFNNNTITTTAGGLISPDTNGVPVVSDGGIVGNVGNSTNGGNMFTDPCLVNGSLNIAAEDTERAFWSNKLVTNNITLGDQH